MSHHVSIYYIKVYSVYTKEEKSQFKTVKRPQRRKKNVDKLVNYLPCQPGSGGLKKNKKGRYWLHAEGHQHAESCDAFMVKQYQTLVKIKIVLLCDSDLKYNYTSVIKNTQETELAI